MAPSGGGGIWAIRKVICLGRLPILTRLVNRNYTFRMTNNIVNLQVDYKHRRIVDAKEMYAQPEPSDQEVWSVCGHIRGINHDFQCRHCPKWEVMEYAIYPENPDGKVQRMCRGLAEEVCKIHTAVLKREGKIS